MWVIFHPLASLAFVPSGDNDYMILEEKKYRVIFDKQYLASINTINRKIKNQLEAMSEFKNRILDEKLTIILISPKTQVSNALATVLPSFTISLYPVGVIGLHELSLPVWFEGVFEHELNHIFQMSHSRSPEILRKVFNMPGLLFFYLYNPYPNLFIPRFIMEGDSVLKESLFHYGGRLYNGYARALVYSQIKHFRYQMDQFMYKHLLRFRLTPHSGREKYLHGGYFMAMLAEVYSHKTVNSFFNLDKRTPSSKIRKQIKEAPVKEFLSPLFAENFSFRQTHLFLKDLTKTYFNHWLKKASMQKSSDEPVLFKSTVCPVFGSKGDEIFFLTSDLKSVSMLRVFNKKTKEWTSKKMDLPLGKVFKIKGRYYARSSKEVKPYTIHYSLFSDGLHNNEQFDSKYIQDLWNKKILYIDPKNNLDGFKLYVNDKLYSDTHSNALFDEKGNIYFFKQKHKKRTLYKNKWPVFSYSGYYGSVQEVRDGTIYFTGSSPYGSSIYQYKNGKTSRSVSSDTVIQAKMINNKEFIACEVTPYGYEYKIIPKKISQGKPVLYQYQFKKRKPLKTVQNSQQTSEDNSFFTNPLTDVQTLASQKEKINSNTERQVSAVTQENKKTDLNYKEYSPLKHIRYTGGTFQGFTAITSNMLGMNFMFADHLLRHIITPGYIAVFPFYDLTDGLHLLNLNYQNRIYPLEWQLGYQLNMESKTKADSSSNGTRVGVSVSAESSLNMEHKGYFLLNYPLFKKGRWFSSISSLKIMELLKSSSDVGTTGLWRGQINWG